VYVNGTGRSCAREDQRSQDSGFYSQFQNSNNNTQELPSYHSSITQNQSDYKVKIQIRYEDNKLQLSNGNNNEVCQAQHRIHQEHQYSTIDSLEDLTEDQHYEYHEKAVDVPEDFEREAYLVFGINQKRSPFKRKICPPIRQIRPASDQMTDKVRFDFLSFYNILGSRSVSHGVPVGLIPKN
jgi:hypothetical protein